MGTLVLTLSITSLGNRSWARVRMAPGQTAVTGTGEADPAHLGRSVVGEANVAVQRGLGGHVDDAAAPAGPHLLHDLPRAPKGRQERDLDHEAPGRLLRQGELRRPLPGAR